MISEVDLLRPADGAPAGETAGWAAPVAPRWPRPVRLNAVITHRKDPVRAVRRASRWASYASRIAVAPAARVDDRALVGAHAHGVWVVG